MKRYLTYLACLLVTLSLKAQNYNSTNSLARVALVYYVQDGKGFFQKKENVNLQEVSEIVSSYGYNKKSHELYLETERANCIVTVNDDLHKILKKSKSIPQMKDDELAAKSAVVNKKLDEKFTLLNQAREKHINDSIQKAREDSIKKLGKTPSALQNWLNRKMTIARLITGDGFLSTRHGYHAHYVTSLFTVKILYSVSHLGMTLCIICLLKMWL